MKIADPVRRVDDSMTPANAEAPRPEAEDSTDESEVRQKPESAAIAKGSRKYGLGRKELVSAKPMPCLMGLPAELLNKIASLALSFSEPLIITTTKRSAGVPRLEKSATESHRTALFRVNRLLRRDCTYFFFTGNTFQIQQDSKFRERRDSPPSSRLQEHVVLRQWLLTIPRSVESYMQDVRVNVNLYRRPHLGYAVFESSLAGVLRSLRNRSRCRNQPSMRCTIEFGRKLCVCTMKFDGPNCESGSAVSDGLCSLDAKDLTIRVDLANLVESIQDSARQLHEESRVMSQHADRLGNCPARERYSAASNLDSLCREIRR